MALKSFNKIMMIEEKAKKGKRRDRMSVVTGGIGGHMGKAAHRLSGGLSSLILISNSLLEKAVVDLNYTFYCVILPTIFTVLSYYMFSDELLFFKIHLSPKQNISGEGSF